MSKRNKFLSPALAGAILAANVAPVIADQGAGRNERGVIVASNEARFTAANYSEPLTAFTTGWRDPENLDALTETLFPSVPVSRRFEFKKGENKEFFYSETDDTRAIGSSFKKVEYTGTTVNEKTNNKGLTICVDHDEQLMPNWQEATVAKLIARIQRNEFRRGIALIDAAADNVAKVWDSNSNPDGDVRSQLVTGASKSGMRGNIVVFGELAWDLRADVYEASAKLYSARAAGMTPDELARKLMVDRVEIVKARYASTAAARTNIVSSVVYSYMAIPGVGKDDPSSVKRFYTPTEGGKYRVYVEEHAKYTEISVEHYSNIVVCSSLGVQKRTVSAS